MAELGTGRSQGTGLRRYLGQHESDVGLQVLSRSPPLPGTLPQGAKQAEKGEKGRDHERSVCPSTPVALMGKEASTELVVASWRGFPSLHLPPGAIFPWVSREPCPAVNRRII